MYCKMKTSQPSEPSSLKCCCILPLKKCSIDEILSKGIFKVTCHNETLILCSPSADEGDAWITALRQAVKQVGYSTVTVIRLNISRWSLHSSLKGYNEQLIFLINLLISN